MMKIEMKNKEKNIQDKEEQTNIKRRKRGSRIEEDEKRWRRDSEQEK